MCGIAGFYKPNEMNSSQAENVITLMTDALIHRGPDDSNIFSSQRDNFFLGHRRLAIVDTSRGGLQPMKSQSGNLVISFNGEIYNHLDLRIELEEESQSLSWSSSSDTETLLAAFEQWGVNRYYAIVINYGVASTLGWTLSGGLPMMKTAYEMPWFFLTMAMGLGFLFFSRVG